MKKHILGVATAVALALGSGTASAYTVGTIVAGATTPTNQGVDIVYAPATSAIGFFGATWYLIGGPATTVSVTYLGKEAGDTNTFSITGISETVTCSTNAAPCNGGFSAVGTPVDTLDLANGILSFFFSNPNNGIATNANNPDWKAGDPGVNFFSRISSGACVDASVLCYGGTILDLWFDDLGGSSVTGKPSDDNHDDMVIRLSITNGSVGVVPIPAALPLLLSGLAGLGFIGRRRRVVAA